MLWKSFKYGMGLLFLFPMLSACSGSLSKAPVVPQVNPVSFYETELLHEEEGYASWYGPGFYGRKTASGQRFTKHKFTCAHRKLPFGTRLQITNLQNGKSIEVTVNDRGPFIKGRVVDLSYAAAKEIGLIKAGAAPVKVKQVLLAQE